MLNVIFSIRYKSRVIINEYASRTITSIASKQTLKHRILNYFQSYLNIEKSKKTLESFDHVSNTSDTSLVPSNTILSIEEIRKEFLDLSNVSRNPHEKLKLANQFDMKCLEIISSLKHRQMLCVLNTSLQVLPIQAPLTYSYRECISLLMKAIESGLLNKHEIIQVLFFISIKKQWDIDYINYLLPYLPEMDDLPLIEKCIVAQSFHQLSLKLKPQQLQVVRNIIKKHFDELIDEPCLLIPLCKLLIKSDLNNSVPLHCLTEAIMDYKKPFEFRTAVAILNLYAQALSLETTVIDYLVKNIVEYIEEDIYKHNLMIHDISMFLWSTSYLGFTLSVKAKETLKKYFKLRLEEYKSKKNLGILINTILCLHMHRASNLEDIICKCIEERVFDPLIREKFHWKIRSNFQLLIHQISLDQKIDIPKRFNNQVNIGYVPSENIKFVADTASALISDGILQNVVIQCPIKSLIIPGVTLKTAKSIYHIDVLDNTTCLRNTNIPHGFMNLKLHLLSRLKYTKILINGEILKKDPAKARHEIQQRIMNTVSKDLTVLNRKTLKL